MKIIRLSEDTFARAVEEAYQALLRGGIVLYPTDTLYGLAVDAHNAGAVARLKALKGRETKKPISVVVSSLQRIEEYARLNEVSRSLAEAHLPGALTLVLPANPQAPEDLQLIGTIGVRIPDHAFSLALANKLQRAFTATSANRSTIPTERTAEAVLRSFGPLSSEIDVVIDSGELDESKGSTVVSVRADGVYVLREGEISRELIDRSYGN